ncbi:MAG: RDD family protein [Burkholderiaceae bacterium]|jgi:uncharacterized RDD family membrane protein YckC|nr:RDD family protein [Burkholderiaceae bacterium]
MNEETSFRWLGWLLVLFTFIGLALALFSGIPWAVKHLLDPLINLGWLALATDIVILLPLSLFRRLRGFTGWAIVATSFLFGFVTLMLSFLLVWDLWGWWGIVIGFVFFSTSFAPMALLATMLHGLWPMFFGVLILLILTFGARIIGLWIATMQQSTRQDEMQQLTYPLATRWPRFFARIFDLWWELSLTSFVISFILGAYSSKFIELFSDDWIKKLFIILCVPLALILDAIIYRLVGNTPGKALLGLRVVSHNSSRLSFSEYLERNLLLWKSGLGFGIPFVNLITMINQYQVMREEGQTSYDTYTGNTVCAKPTEWMQKPIFTILFLFMFLFIIATNSNERSRQQLATHKSATENSPVATTQRTKTDTNPWEMDWNTPSMSAQSPSGETPTLSAGTATNWGDFTPLGNDGKPLPKSGARRAQASSDNDGQNYFAQFDGKPTVGKVAATNSLNPPQANIQGPKTNRELFNYEEAFPAKPEHAQPDTFSYEEAFPKPASPSHSPNRAGIEGGKTAQTQEQVFKRDADEWIQAVQTLASEIKGQEGAPDYTQDDKMAQALGQQVKALMVARGLDPARNLVPLQDKINLVRQAHRVLMRDYSAQNVPVRAWTMDYEKAYESANWSHSNGDDYKIHAGIFDTQGSFGPQVIGMVLRTDFNSPRKIGNSQIDSLVTFYMFDCGARTYADLGSKSLLEANVVSSNLTDRYPQFSTPSDSALKKALDTYCAFSKKG